jgi:hypothetical protein
MPNIDFDQEPRGAADRGEHRQAAGAFAEAPVRLPPKADIAGREFDVR